MNYRRPVFLILILLFVPLLLIGQTFAVADSFIRAGNVTQYSIGDLFSTATPRFLRFSGVVRYKGSTGILRGIILALDTSTSFSGTLMLCSDTSGITLPADNAPCRLPVFAAVSKLVSTNQLQPTQHDSSNVAIQFAVSGQYFKCAPGKTDLYGWLTVRSNPYTPKISGSVYVRLLIARDEK